MLKSASDATSPVPSNQLEQQVLKFNLIVTAIMGVFISLLAIWTNSGALMLDGAFGLSDLLFSWAAFKVSKLIHHSHTPKYPFGYHAFEALLNVLNALMMMGLLAFSGLMALLALSNGGTHAQTLSVFMVALVSGLLCMGMWRFTAAKNRQCQSELLKLDAINWKIDGLISLAVAVGFFAASIIEKTPAAYLAPYFDPSIVLLICLLVFREPLRIFKRFLKQLLGANISPSLSSRINSLYTMAFLQNSPAISDFIHDDLDIECRSMELGRMLYIWIELKVPYDHKLAELRHQFGLRNDLEHLYTRNFTGRTICLDVIFTPIEDEPTHETSLKPDPIYAVQHTLATAKLSPI